MFKYAYRTKLIYKQIQFIITHYKEHNVYAVNNKLPPFRAPLISPAFMALEPPAETGNPTVPLIMDTA